MNVLVVVASQTGRTARMADAVAAGARDAGAEAVVKSADMRVFPALRVRSKITSLSPGFTFAVRD